METLTSIIITFSVPGIVLAVALVLRHCADKADTKRRVGNGKDRTKHTV